VLLSACAGNQRQIGAALNVYAAEHDDYLPVCKFSSQSSWYTYEAARSAGGGGPISQGFMNLGLLFRTRALPDPRQLYCPAQMTPAFTYEYYTQGTNGWPAGPASDGNVRTGYSYFPQLRQTAPVGGVLLPRVTLTTVQLEFGSLVNSALTPMKISELNPQRSIAVDLLGGNATPHQTQGELIGLNAVFPDGNVAFQDVQAHPDLFAPSFWQYIGTDSIRFRIAMRSWEQ